MALYEHVLLARQDVSAQQVEARAATDVEHARAGSGRKAVERIADTGKGGRRAGEGREVGLAVAEFARAGRPDREARCTRRIARQRVEARAHGGDGRRRFGGHRARG